MRISLWMRAFNKLRHLSERAHIAAMKSRLEACGENVFIGANCVIWPESGVQIGNNAAIHSFTHIFGSGGVKIGNNVMISAACSITSVSHPISVAQRQEMTTGRVTIEDDVWIGTGAIVLPGVEIGRGSIVAAGAVVTHDVEPYSIVAGIPGRRIRSIEPS